MEYHLSDAEFCSGKMFDSNGKLIHKTGYRIKVFPFVTQPNSIPVTDLSRLIGTFLCRIEDKKPAGITVPDLVNKLKLDTDIEPGSEQLFYETVKQLFFDTKERLRPLNLQMLSLVYNEEVSEEKVAEFLVDVLGSKVALKSILETAKAKEMDSSNVLERLVLKHLGSTEIAQVEDAPYYQVITSLISVFEDDFRYILENQNRVREYLIFLLDLYFFSYTAQVSMQLDRFLDGERDHNIPLYFCLEWEKTSQSRQCFTEGWQRLQYAIEKMFAHVVTLEILNHTETGSECVDYIALREICCEPEKEEEISKQIDEITEIYRKAINDCGEMRELKKDPDGDPVSASLKYLFNSVKCQFENTVRSRAYNSYARKFESFCHRFLKSRGRSGLMLSLSEETLIFLPKISIKGHEQMRLKDVFEEFEKRGVFLDEISKEQVTSYYEKLNLIEKKSDSGDAKYVKRIL